MAENAEGLASGEIAKTPRNRQAGRLLERLRQNAQAQSKEFAFQVGENLGVPLTLSRYSKWESGTRAVPAAVLLAAAALTGTSLDALVKEPMSSEEEAALRLEVTRLRETVGNLNDRVDRLERRPRRSPILQPE